jgi:hypothetical protein
MARTARNTNAHSRRNIRNSRIVEIAPDAATLAVEIAPDALTANITPDAATPIVEMLADPAPQIHCPTCQTEISVSMAGAMRLGGVKCPGCGRWLHVRLFPDLSRYVRGLGVTPSGHDTLDIADDAADLLRSLPLPEMYDQAAQHLAECGIEAMSKGFRKGWGDSEWDAETIATRLGERYADRNPGMQRMNVGNLLRSALKRRSEINAQG